MVAVHEPNPLHPRVGSSIVVWLDVVGEENRANQPAIRFKPSQAVPTAAGRSSLCTRTTAVSRTFFFKTLYV
jgi:hypothetical protein